MEQQIKDYALPIVGIGGDIFEAGETVIAFDGGKWIKTGDIGDNSQFRHEAQIIDIYYKPSFFGGTDYLADIQWKHNGEISKGHFVNGLKKINN